MYRKAIAWPLIALLLVAGKTGARGERTGNEMESR